MQHLRLDVVIDNIAYTHEDALSSIRAFRGRLSQYLFTSSVAVYTRRQTLRPLREADADLTVELDPAKAEGGFHPSGRLDYAIGKRAVEREFMKTARPSVDLVPRPNRRWSGRPHDAKLVVCPTASGRWAVRRAALGIRTDL